MEICPNYPLLEHNTFRIKAHARWWIVYKEIDDLRKLARDEYFATLPFISLGLGANTLFLNDYQGAVLHSEIKSIERVDKEVSLSLDEITDTEPLLRVGSGVVWDDLVALTLENGLYGLENLSGIPASVGAAIIQNIGAYGSEVGQFVEEVEYFNLKTGELCVKKGRDCSFQYRYSLFKESEYASCVLTSVTFKLSYEPKLNLSYKVLAEAFLGEIEPSPYAIRLKVLSIRNSKLPKVEEYPNAGSFFKNPLVSLATLEKLQQVYPKIPYWSSPNGDEKVKIPAAWLIEQAGYKGKRSGYIGCYPLQPLVIVNYGASSGGEIQQFAEEVKMAVESRFGILLEPEVRYVE